MRNRLFCQKKLRKKCVNPGVIFGPFGVILGHFGSFLGHIGPFWAIWSHIWATLGHFGSFLAIFGPFCCIFGQICGKFKFVCGIVGVTILAFRIYGDIMHFQIIFSGHTAIGMVCTYLCSCENEMGHFLTLQIFLLKTILKEMHSFCFRV